jgi:ABC-type nitrate/sulfonate/bicarbonate transport system permease component
MFSSILKQINTNYLKISHVYRVSKFLTIKKIVLPQIIPVLISSLINGFSLATKIDILTEATIGSRGIGYLISYNFYLFDLSKVLALTIIFITIMFYIPKTFQKIYLTIKSRLKY